MNMWNLFYMYSGEAIYQIIDNRYNIGSNSIGLCDEDMYKYVYIDDNTKMMCIGHEVLQ